MNTVEPKTDLEVTLVGEDGNIFNLVGLTSKELKRNGYREYAQELNARLHEQKSYEEALNLISEYVTIL